MNFKDFLQTNIVRLDGAMGTVLQARGLQTGELPETWNLSHPEEIYAIHKAYFDAGSHVVCTNTFGANALKFDKRTLEEVVRAALALAHKAKADSLTEQEKFVALSVGGLGKLFKPFGDLDFEDAVALFAETVRLGAKHGADLIFIETMNDSYEAKAAVLAAKENSTLPVLVSCAYTEDETLMTGASPEAMVALLEGLGADALGAGCSLGPQKLMPVVERLLASASVPVILKPNAGLPRDEGGKTVFDVDTDEFSACVTEAVKRGVRVVGGCCGTTPEYISNLTQKTRHLSPAKLCKKEKCVVSSYSHAVEFGVAPILIGERINPTGKKRLKEALLRGDMDYVLAEGAAEADRGAQILDVNVGLPDVNEPELLVRAVCELQATLSLPLQIDTASPAAMERALRRYNGKALINSVNGKEESMQSIFPLAKKYGGVIVALTLDENGIPETAEGRLAVAERILKRAKEYGIDQHDLVFDPLALTVSADKNAANTTLAAVKLIRAHLGCHTLLGVSNVSFGLPRREDVNAAFFALAMENGLSAAIMNPHSEKMMSTYRATLALKGLDEGCENYIRTAEDAADTTEYERESTPLSACRYAITKGLKEQAAEATRALLASQAPLEIVNTEIIPALDLVGRAFEEKTLYLPGLLMSAEAAKSAFEVVKSALGTAKRDGPVFVLATVRGDVHDIGKNIVKLLLENYGFSVVDLGRDVPPESILAAVQKHRAPLVGLSALMTTTVCEMEKTIRLLHAEAPWCKIIVGGAVLTAAYAEKIGANRYAKDAMDGVRAALEFTKA